MQDAFSTADLALARRIEAAEAANGFAIARAIAAASPELNAAAEPFLGGVAMFGGVGSPMTHALGMGMCGPIDEAELDRMEAFFRDRGSPVLIDLCPMADMGLISRIVARGYRLIEFNNVMVRRIAPGEQIPAPAMDVELAGECDLELWNRTIARGFQEIDDVDEAVLAMLSGSAAASRCYLVRIGGEPAGGGAMSVHDGVAAFYGDSTVLRSRRQGVQLATLQARLRDAADAGADLAMACVLPGSGSHRNYEKAGFRLFFMRVNLMLP
ncbi:MAG TPA: hypothetical protein VN428_09925 [Bryobacteraceae bacterium]|nr:hypothetical protein [Bryobacteraceae bacterium]